MKMVALGEVARFIRGVTFKPSDVSAVSSPDRIGVMRTKNVQSELDLSDVVYIPRELVRRDDQLVQANDILISSANSWNLVGKCCWIPELAGRYAVGGFIIGLRVSSREVDARYLYRWLSSSRVQALLRNTANQTTNIANLNLRRCEQLSIPLPPLDEQRRIAAILDQADKLRAERRRTSALLLDLDRSTFFGKFGDPSDRSSKWTRVTLGELMVEGGPQNGLYKPSSEYGAGVPIVRIDSFQDGSAIDIERLKRVRVSQAEAANYDLNVGDIVINRVNARSHLGKATVVSELAEPTIFESNMMRLRLDPLKSLPEYVMAFLGTPYAKAQIRTAAKDAVNQSSINQTDVANFELPLPPIEDQADYVRCSRGANRLHSTCMSMAKELDELFTCLQSHAFSGQL